MKLLFFGDLVGSSGRKAASACLNSLPERPDVVIANVENTTHGFGLNRKHYDELSAAGIHAFTSGNHIWDRKEIFDYIQDADRLLRPQNFPSKSPGTGIRAIDANGYRVGIINLIGQVYMGNYNSPWESLDMAVATLKPETDIIFLDFHAEATAEKVGMGHYAASIGVSAMVGTHTHVQTADERILGGRMGYITDAGFNGAYDSVIGMRVESSLQRLKDQVPSKLDVADSDTLQVNAVLFEIDPDTGVCTGVSRVNRVLEAPVTANA